MVSATIVSLFLKRPDVVIGTSPQFFTAVAAWLVATIRRCPFVFELRDLWPETILAVGAMRRGFAVSFLERFASFLYRQADLMVPVTNAFAGHLEEEGVDPSRIVVVTNGIEPASHIAQQSREEVRARWGIPQDAFVAGYVGTMGMCHGVSTVLNGAEQTRGDSSFHYVLMGEGADKQEIEKAASDKRLENVTIVDGQPHQGAIDLLSAIDVSLVLLRDSPLFETVIPSKIFEAMDLQKPILLGVKGESRAIVVDEVGCGIAFPPEDAQAMVAGLRKLEAAPELAASLGRRGRAAVEQRFRRSELARRMLSAIEEMLAARSRAARQRSA
jgi:glycosyltransferase involved in cell wall biosynthesis